MNNLNAKIDGSSASSKATLLPSYIIGTSSDKNFMIDRENLRNAGFILGCRLTSANAVLDYVRNNSSRTIILDSSISGAPVPELIRNIRSHLRIEPAQIVVISEIAHENFVVDVITAGCTGFIIRPYGLKELNKYLTAKPEIDDIRINEEQLEIGEAYLNSGHFDEAIEQFKEITETNTEDEHNEAQKYYNMGMNYLLEKKYNKSIVAFNNALRINRLYIKAYEGLARAYQGKGNMAEYQDYLQKAAEEYAKLDNFNEVKRVFAEITKHDVHAPNAYNTLGLELRRKCLYNDAINAYRNALKITPNDENIHYNQGKAQYFAELYPEALRSFQKCLSLNPSHSVALVQYRKMTGAEWDEDVNAPLLSKYRK